MPAVDGRPAIVQIQWGVRKKRRREDYNPRDLRDFMNTQIEVATADGAQKMDRRTALLNKLFEGAMKGKATPMRLLLADIKESDRQLAELRLAYERLEAELIHDNPDFKDIDESLTRQQRIDLLGMASALNHYYPGAYDAILGKSDDKASDEGIKEILAKLDALKTNESGES